MFPLNSGNLKSNADFGLYAIFPYLELEYDIYAKKCLHRAGKNIFSSFLPNQLHIFLLNAKDKNNSRNLGLPYIDHI